MENIAVVCNNIKEWQFFCDSLCWNLSKQNLPYKMTPTGFEHISNDTAYHYAPNNIHEVKGGFAGVLWCCKPDKELEERLCNT
jgi:hypothetical protein